MPFKINKKLARLYAMAITFIAPFYKLVFKPQRETALRKVVLLISRPQDIELLIGLHVKAQHSKELSVSFWVVNNCASRYPEVLCQLQEKKAVVQQVISYVGLAKAMIFLRQTDVFLSTVESTAAKNKLPYILTRLANSLDVATYTLQHGYPNLGLNFCDHVYGSDIRFEAKTVLTWGPVDALHDWVSDETKSKCVAVGCPKELVLFGSDLSNPSTDRPIIAVFENLHGHGYDKKYIADFLGNLQEAAKDHKDFRFILKSHPASLRCRTEELSDMFNRLTDVEITDRADGKDRAYTTPWLLANALGAITTPSTVALDGAMVGVPVALARYGLDLSIYSPLPMLDSSEDWENFLGELIDGNELKLRSEEFRGRVIVPGDAATRILALMAG